MKGFGSCRRLKRKHKSSALPALSNTAGAGAVEEMWCISRCG